MPGLSHFVRFDTFFRRALDGRDLVGRSSSEGPARRPSLAPRPAPFAGARFGAARPFGVGLLRDSAAAASARFVLADRPLLPLRSDASARRVTRFIFPGGGPLSRLTSLATASATFAGGMRFA